MKMAKKELNWGPTIFLITYQVLFLATLPIYLYYYTPSWGMLLASFILLYLTGLSITAGYHRYYSHRTYRTNKWVESFLLFFGAMAGQSSVLRWSFDHRLHHAHVDTDEDPYSINKGFWYAHCWWILDKPKTIEAKVVPDLMKNKMVMFQDRHIGKLMIITNTLAFLFVGWLLNDYWGAFYIALWARLFTLHHSTWFINSLAHTWGDKPYSQEQTAVNNYVISFLTFGEGYHNYHHTFANDYRNGIRWFHFDPTKWLIWTLNKLGLAYDLKRMSAHAIKKKMVLEHKSLLMEQIKAYWHTKTDELEQQVNEISDRIVVKISEFNRLKERYNELKREHSQRDILNELHREIKALKKSMKDDWREWTILSRNILYSRPQLA